MLCATARTLARSQALARVWPHSAARADPLSDRRDGKLIALRATPSDDRGSDPGDIRQMPKLFSRMDIRQVNFDDRSGHGGQSIPDRDRCVRQCTRVDDEPDRARAQLVDRVDQHTLMVALAEVERETQASGILPGAVLDVGEGCRPIDGRLALAEQVEIRPVEDGDDSRHAASMPRLPARETRAPSRRRAVT